MTETKNIERSFLPSGCLSESGMMGFIQQELTEAEMEQASAHFLHCELCRLALRGIESNPDFLEINRLLQQQIDLLITGKPSDPIHTIQPKTKAVPKRMLFYLKAFRNIAAVVPVALTLGSALWLTAAIMIYDHLSVFRRPISDPSLQTEIPNEIRELEKQIQALSPPAPQITEFNIIHEEIVFDDEISIDADEEIVIEYQPSEPFMEAEVAEDNEVFVVVEELPQFPGGQEALHKFLSQNLKYPQSAKQEKIQGTVYVTFIISNDGNVDSASILLGVHWSLDEEAMRVIRDMPQWIPGKLRGKPVNVQITMPVRFTLE
ncbi:MAG: energy transducer TonB [Bacteroidales bacterium]|nr:energy transducer TonB [Bacteroidales bacterium]